MKQFTLLLFLLAGNALSVSTEHKIKLLAPGLNSDRAKEYALSIDNYIKISDVNVDVILAIFKVESNFNHKAVNYKSRDFGIGQINALNMVHYNFDLGLQMTDYDYAIRNTIKILEYTKQVYEKKENEFTKGLQKEGCKVWYTRYHSYSCKYREIYYKKLKVQLDKLRSLD